MKLRNLTNTVALATLLTATSASAFNTDFLSASVHSEMDYGTTADSDWADNSGLSLRAEITLEAQISDAVRAVITAEIKEGLMASGEWQSLDLDDNKLEEMIREAYVEVKMVKGVPMAFVIGKQEIAFGQNFSGLAMSDRGTNSRMSGISRVDGVVGMTVKLDTNFFGLIDSVEGSVFENGSGDLEVGELNNYSVRMGGDLAENIRMSASYMNRDLGGAEREQTASVGVIYTNGDWTAHVEGIGMIDNNDLADSDLAVNTGLAYDTGHGTVAVEYAWIQDSVKELGLSYETEIADGVSVGPQVNYDVDSGDVTGGVRLTFKKKLKVAKKGATVL
jgi:hypothetical protein